MKSTLKAAEVALSAALVATALLAIGGCSDSSSPVIPKSEPTFTPVFATDAEAVAAAEKDYAGYIATIVSVANSDHPNPELISAWVTPAELKPLVDSYYRIANAGDRERGAITVLQFTLQDLQQKPSGRVILTAYACDDVSEFYLVDKTGSVLTSPDSQSILPMQVQFRNAKPGSKTLLMNERKLWTGRDFC
jgi:hypothetical protein